MKVFLKILGGSFLFLILIVSVLWLFPSLILNSSVVRFAVKKQRSVQFEPEFPKDFSIHARNDHFSNQSIEIHMGAFCMKTQDDSIKICVKNIDLALIAAFDFRFHPHFKKIGPVNIAIIKAEIRNQESTVSKNQDQTSFAWPKLDPKIQVEPIHLQLEELVLHAGKEWRKISIDLKGEKAAGDQYSLSLHGKMKASTDPEDALLDLDCSLDSQYDVEGKFVAKVFSPGKIPRVDLSAQGKLNLITTHGQVSGSAKIVNLTDLVPVIELKKFTIDNQKTLQFSGIVEGDLAIGTIGNPKHSALPPPKFHTRLSANVNAERSENKTQFSLKIDPLENYGLILNAKVSGNYGEDESALSFSELWIKADIAHFQKTVAQLKATQYAIPSPLNELQGSIHLELGLEKILNFEKQTLDLPLRLETDLQSSRQALVTKSEGDLHLVLQPFAGELKLKTVLDRVSIVAPNLDPILPLPVIISDYRIVENKKESKAKKEKEDAPSTFKIKLEVITGKNSIRIYHRLFDPAVLFRLNAVSEPPQDPTFNIIFDPFKISYLKRTAELSHLKVSDKPGQALTLDGRLIIRKTDYTIFADIGNIGGKTSISLSADPPLPESDIISLILFNQLASELDSSGSDSVQDTHAALENRALGFFSFWILSTTPVEAVAYNPTTQVYSARVKVANGLSATVGTNWDKTQEVALRKRLGGKWVISAGLITDSEGERHQESMLEWYNRY